jgi:hypothetical protein
MFTQIQVSEDAAFVDQAARDAFAKFVAGIFAADKPTEHIPYPTTPGETHEYVIDKENDWFLNFDRVNNLRVSLNMRIPNETILEAATRFVAYRYGNSELHSYIGNANIHLRIENWG